MHVSNFAIPTSSIASVLGRIAAACALAAVLIAAAAPAADAQNVRTKATVHDSAERIETVPIGRDAFAKPRSAISLPIGSLGRIGAGDRIRAGGEVQMSVCLKPNSNHPGPGHDCLGKVYGYDPKLKAKLVLAPKEDSSGGPSTTALSPVVSVKCTQRQPGRNHHCVLGVPVTNFLVSDPKALACNPSDCRINMVVSAHHNQANSKGKEKVVVGALKSNGSVDQGAGKITVARIPSGSRDPKLEQTNQRNTKKVPVVAKTNSNLNERVVMSLRVPRLRAGEQLLIESRIQSTIGHLSYNVLNRTRMVLAGSPDSTTHSHSLARKVAGSTTKLSASNGYNCTQAKSGFSKVCKNLKTGVLDVRNSTSKALFINVVAGQRAQLFYHRWRSGDGAKVPKRVGYIKAWRYAG